MEVKYIKEIDLTDKNDKVTRFIFDTGVSQYNLYDGLQSYASLDARLKSITEYHKNLGQDVLTLCESGLFCDHIIDDEIDDEIEDGSKEVMYCYCCHELFMKWAPKVDPWVLHAMKSPKCPHLLLHKGNHFVDSVHKTIEYIESCSIPVFMKKFFECYTFDKILEDYDFESLSAEDLKRSYNCLEPLVSESMRREFPDLFGPVTVDLDKVPLPMNITCKICFDRKLEVMFIPCGHIIACIQCAITLIGCPVCRESFSVSKFVLRIFIVEKNNNDNVESTNSEISDDSNENVLCRMCDKEKINVVFFPCRHVHSCDKCAIKLKSCPVCSVPFLDVIYVFI